MEFVTNGMKTTSGSESCTLFIVLLSGMVDPKQYMKLEILFL